MPFVFQSSFSEAGKGLSPSLASLEMLLEVNWVNSRSAVHLWSSLVLIVP